MNDFKKIALESADDEDALRNLHQHGASPVEAIKALKDARGVSLGVAKGKLMSSPHWTKEAKAADELHTEIIKLLDR